MPPPTARPPPEIAGRIPGDGCGKNSGPRPNFRPRDADVRERQSSRDGVDEEFDPARQAQFVLNERLHHGLATESLVETLLAPATSVADVM